MGFSKMHSTQVGLVIALITSSIPPQYYVVFDDILSTVTSSTAADPELWIRMVTSRNPRIQVMLDHSSSNSGSSSWYKMTWILEFLDVTSLIHTSGSVDVPLITVENM